MVPERYQIIVSFHSLPKRGKLIPALAVSVLLHFALLWPGIPSRNGDEVAPALVAHLRPAAEPVSARPPASRPLPLPDHSQTATAVLATPIATTNDSTTAVPLRSEPPATSVAGAVAGAAAPAVVAAARGEGGDAEGMRRYRLALAVEAGRFKRYPARAKEANMTGTVEIRVAVAATGQADEIEVARSSGYGLLDDAALDMMKRAAARASVPEALRNRTFSVNLPVVFDLTSE